MSYFGVQVCPITFHAGCFHLLEDITKSLLAKSLHVPHASEIRGGRQMSSKTFSETEVMEEFSVQKVWTHVISYIGGDRHIGI